MYPESQDRPKLLGDASALEQRRAYLHTEHMGSLVAFVAELRADRNAGAVVPDFDPWDGGDAAEVLYLMQSPGPKAIETGFVSRNNPDETAKNFFELCAEAGLARRRTVTWNVVPWSSEDGTPMPELQRRDIGAGLLALARLLELLPKLRAVVLLGRKAESARYFLEQKRTDLRVFCAPNPSPLFVNNAPGNRDRILVVLREVATFLDSDALPQRV